MLAEQPELANAKTEDGLSAVLLAVYLGHSQLGRMLAERRSDLTIFEASATGDLARVRGAAGGQPGLGQRLRGGWFPAARLGGLF